MTAQYKRNLDGDRNGPEIQTLFIDDLDGSEAEGTVRFALDGASYEIDLNPVHAGELRAVMARYTQAARRVTAVTRRPGRTTRGKTADGLSTAEVREWARHNDIEIKERGRIPADVAARFQAATAR